MGQSFYKGKFKVRIGVDATKRFHNAEQTLQGSRSASSKESITNQEHLAKYVYCYLGRLNTKFKEYTKALEILRNICQYHYLLAT